MCVFTAAVAPSKVTQMQSKLMYYYVLKIFMLLHVQCVLVVCNGWLIHVESLLFGPCGVFLRTARQDSIVTNSIIQPSWYMYIIKEQPSSIETFIVGLTLWEATLQTLHVTRTCTYMYVYILSCQWLINVLSLEDCYM